ncbi:MAG TPA: DUF5700 domain-containing putative Zn-dependent protease [Chitinophagaceae bacterium]
MDMKHRFLCLFISSLLASTTALAQVNTTSIESYFEIVETLKQDKDPAPQVWQAFFEQTGNQLVLKGYRRGESFRDTLKSLIQLVYMPSKRGQLQNTQVNFILENILYTHDHEAAIKEHLAFVKEGGLLDSMYGLAYRYLPADRQKKVKNLVVYYIGPLALDSRALNDTLYINTTMEARFFPKRTVYIGAHELHHILLGSETSYKSMTADQARYAGITIVANSLLREGVADLIDKKHFQLSANDTIYRPLMEKSLQESDSMIVKLNTELERLATAPNKPAQLRSFMSRGGHTPGQHMALVIERNGYLPELLNNIRNPFAFLYIYNKAAQIDAQKPARFSPAAIAFLQRVEKLFP